MNLKFLPVLAAVAIAACHAATVPLRGPMEEALQPQRQKRTLGLLTAGANAVGTGLGALGAATATAVGVTVAAKPLVLLGLGGYALYRHAQRNQVYSPAFGYSSSPYGGIVDPIGSSVYLGENSAFVDAPFVDQGGWVVQEPAIASAAPVGAFQEPAALVVNNGGW